MGNSHVTKCKVLEDKDMFDFCCCVLSSRDAPAGAHYLANDFDSALELVERKLAEEADQIWVLGGSSLYKVRNTEHPGLFHCLSVTFSPALFPLQKKTTKLRNKSTEQHLAPNHPITVEL